MPVIIKEIFVPDEKSQICNDILRSVSKLFGNLKAIEKYSEWVKNMPFYAALDNEKVIGFVAVKVHNSFTAEVCVMGILEDYHRLGIGRRFIELYENYCRENKKTFLPVKTLDASADYEPYDRTRKFYESMGFVPLEVFPLYWDKDNPCLFLAKYIGI
jgi:GNAT superfamily N-acetyltransferase